MEEITSGPSDVHAELYDSGTTCHISLYYKIFKNFMSTLPKSLKAVNKGKFMAIG